jgi:hypothetical protein
LVRGCGISVCARYLLPLPDVLPPPRPQC